MATPMDVLGFDSSAPPDLASLSLKKIKKKAMDRVEKEVIAYVLEKPVSFFFPPTVRGASFEDLTPDEKELIHFFRQLGHVTLRKVAFNQVKTLSEAALEDQMDETYRDS